MNSWWALLDGNMHVVGCSWGGVGKCLTISLLTVFATLFW